MTDKKISQLNSASTLAGTEILAIVQGGETKKVTAQAIANLGGGGGGGGAVDSVNGQTGVVVLTKSDVALGNVDNTSDINKPISTATQTALNLKANSSALSTVAISGAYNDLTGKPTLGSSASHPASDFATAAQGALADTALQTAPVVSVAGKTGAVALVKADVGLTNVTNDAQLKRSADDYAAITQKTILAGNDVLLIEDVQDAQNKKKTSISNIAGAVSSILSLGEVVTHNSNEFASAAQGALADTALQTAPVISVAGKTGTVTLAKADVGLPNVTDDSQLKRSSADFSSFSGKETLVVGDVILLEDSEASAAKKYTTLQGIKDLATADLSVVATSGSYNDLSDIPENPAGSAGFAHVTYVDAQNGNDTTGEGSLTKPYLTIGKALSIMPTINNFGDSRAIQLSPGAFTETSLLLKPYVSIFGAGKDLTVIAVSPSNEINFDIGPDYEIDGEIKFGLYNLSLTNSCALILDSSGVSNSAGYITLILSNVSIPGISHWLGRPNGGDNLICNNSDINSSLTLRTLPTKFYHSNLSDLLLECQNYSGGGQSYVELHNTPISGTLTVTSSDATRDQIIKASASPISYVNIDANGTGASLEGDAVSIPSSAANVTLANNATLVKTTKQYQIDELTELLAGLEGSNSAFAVYNSDTGKLEANNFLQYAVDGGTNWNNNETLSNPASNYYRNIHFRGFNIELTEDVPDVFTNLYRYQIQLDQSNAGFNYGVGSNNGLGFMSSYLGHRGSGRLERIDHQNHFIELGNEDTPVAGECGFVSMVTNNLVVRPQYECTDHIRLHFAGIEIRSNAEINSFTGFEQNNQMQENSTINSGFISNSLNLGVSNGCVVDNATHIQMNYNINSGAVTGYVNGLNINYTNDGSMEGAQGISINFNGNGSYAQGPTGVNVNMGTFDSSLQRRGSFSGNGGSWSNAQEISTVSNMFFDQGNVLFNLFTVQDGSPITGTAFISNNFSTGFYFKDDMDSGILGLGATGVGMVGQLAVVAGKTAQLINCAVGGVSIPDLPDLGGTLEKAHIFAALGVISQGGPDNVIVEEVRGFVMPAGSLGLARWGVDIQDPDAENRFSKSLVIGASTSVVSNNDIALEIADKKALKLTSMTIAERDALTAISGMIVLIEDGDIKELEIYNGTNWIRTPQLVEVPGSSSSTGVFGQMAISSGWLYTCVATDTWERSPTVSW